MKKYSEDNTVMIVIGFFINLFMVALILLFLIPIIQFFI
jgi:hypothetical protein